MEKSEESSAYEARLNHLLANFSIAELQNFHTIEGESIQSSSEAKKLNLFGCDFLIAKRKVVEALARSFQNLQDKEAELLAVKIRPLSSSHEALMKGAIVGLYCDLHEFVEQWPEEGRSKNLETLIKKLLEILEPGLRDYFIWKKISQLEECQVKHKSIFSERSINKSPKFPKNDSSFKNISDSESYQRVKKQLQKVSISQMLHEEMEGEENELFNKLETCRICQVQFPLEKLQKHVSYCSKKEQLKINRNQIAQKQDAIVEIMKQQLIRGIGNDNLTKIYRNIIISFTKAERTSKRVSSSGLKGSDRRISHCIEQFYEEFQQIQMLKNFKSLEHQRHQIEKQIERLEYQYTASHNDSFDSKSNRSSVQKGSLQRITRSNKTKKSIFAPRDSDSQSDHNEGSIKKLRTFDSKRWKSIKEKDQNPLSTLKIEEEKLCKSLTSIKFEEENKIQIKFENFEILKFLGKGAFGKVYLARRKNTKDIYAMKVIKIQENWGQKQLKLIQNQHEIFRKIGGDYLVKASFSFNQGSAHFFILEYMPGGDLAKVLEEEVYLENDQARFYLAEIILAIEHLHHFRIIHRDLKPENLVFDEKGHLKLTDFGLSEIRIGDKIKKVRQLTSDEVIMDENIRTSGYNTKQPLVDKKSNHKIIGTPDYIAPEVINKKSLDNPSIDWWSLGVLAYEMLIGCRPFGDDTIQAVIDNILSYRITWPEIGNGEDMIDPRAADLLKNLLNPNFKQRLGVRGVQEIKAHPFFEGVDWGNIREETAPFCPKFSSFSNLNELEANQELYQEVLLVMKNSQKNHNLRVQNFVRFDLLMDETLQSADKIIEQHDRKFRRLRSVVQNESKIKNKNKRVSIELQPNFLFNLRE